jgi:hypothetical protein
MKYNYRVLKVLGMRAEGMEKQLNDLGAEGYAVVYANEAIIILGRKEPEGKGIGLPTQRSAVVLTPSMN